MNKRIFSVLTIISLLFNSIPMVARAQVNEIQTTSIIEENCDEIAVLNAFGRVEVETAEDLLEISNNILNKVTNYKGVTIVLNNDIDLSDKTWIPLGTTSNPFGGSIDGNGFTISGLKSSNERSALIGSMSADGTHSIQNLNVEVVLFSGKYSAGVISDLKIGDNGSVKIKNCNIQGNIAGTSLRSGGVIGTLDANGGGKLEVVNCDINMSIDSDYTWSDAYASVGGIVGDTSASGVNDTYLYIMNCNVSGNLKTYVDYGYCSSNVGGFIGNSCVGNVIIEQCSSTAAVTCEAYYAHTGGMVGVVNLSTTSSMQIVNSYVNASVTAKCINGSSQAGGMIGRTTGGGGKQIEIVNSYVTGGMSARNKAGFVSWHGSGECPIIQNSFFNTDTTGLSSNKMVSQLATFSTNWLTANINNSKGLSTSAMKQQENYKEWNFDKVWSFTSGLNGDYPVLLQQEDTLLNYESSLSEVDKELIEKVKLYTSVSGETYLKQIELLSKKLENATPEQKMKVLTEFYTKAGFNDIQEAITYCQDALQARRAYDFLTNDDVFCAYQYFIYLNTTPKGQVARGLLMADDCIFNNSLKQYIDPSTYITEETQAIKNYKDLLLDFMGYSTLDIELPEQLKNMQKAAMAAAELTDETVQSNYIKRIEKSKTIEELKKIVEEMLNDMEPSISGDKTIELHIKGYDGITKMLGKSETTFDIFAETMADLEYVALLETRVQLLDKYSVFLQTIVDGEEVLPYGMVVAAEQLQEEMLNPYEDVVKQIVGQLTDHVTNDAFDMEGYLADTLDDTIVSNLPKEWQPKCLNLGGALETIELGAWVIDCGIGIGTTVKKSAWVEAYSYLGMYYETLLMQCKADFLKEQSVENAWRFYDVYQFLFAIRANGEKAYLEMCDAQGILGILVDVCGWNYFDIVDKRAFVQDTLDYMNNKCVFELENAQDIGTEHFYAQKAVIECPVNVEIYDSNGILIYTLYDGQICDESNEYGRFVCDYVPSIGEYVKAVYLNDDAEYEIKAVGVDAGNVNIKTAQNVSESVETAQIVGLPILKDGVITTKISTGDYIVDSNGDGAEEVTGTMADTSDNENIIVKNISLNNEEVTLEKGEKYSLGISVEPQNATYTYVDWKSDAEDVVTVFNGAITAVGVGTATIQAKCGDIVASCVVHVESIITDLSFNKTSTTLNVGETETLIVTVSPSDATNKELIWSSDNPDVATVSGGIINAKTAGIANISATTTDGSEKVATCIVTVKQPVTEVSLNKTSTALNVGETENLTVTISPANASNKSVTWCSSNTDVATINDGVITALKPGDAIISVSVDDKRAQCNVTVLKPVSDIGLSVKTLELKIGESFVVTTEIAPADASDKSVKWNVSDVSVAMVENGKVTALNAGTTVLTAVTSNGKEASCLITVTEKKPIIKLGDVDGDSWKFEFAQYAYEKGFMSGKGFDANGNIIFDPDGPLTREQFAQILYNAEGTVSIEYSGVFVDVANGQWYTSAVLWAAEQGIVSGYGNGVFGVQDRISREQLAVMLYNYASIKGYDVDARTSLDSFADNDECSDWAEEQLCWAVANGVMSGKGEILDPLGGATRAECAAMLKNFMDKFGE